jgi:hypothetical protein
MFMKITAAFMALLLFASTAVAGPFGIDVDNFTPEKYKCELVTGIIYDCTNLPAKHPDISIYLIDYIPEIGICQISGISSDIRDDNDGTELMKAMDEIYNQLRGKYGDAVKNDELFSDDSTQHKTWMMNLYQGSQQYKYIAKLDPKIDGISLYSLYSRAETPDISSWSVRFETGNADRCDLEVKRKEEALSQEKAKSF